MEPLNYRPFSLTCILCDFVEHINKQSVLYELQHGFREKLSCETQLIQLVEELGG